MMTKSNYFKLFSVCIIAPLTFTACSFCNSDNKNVSNQSTTQNKTSVSTESLAFDNSAWNYDETNNVYWQIGVTYCSNPEDKTFETLGIYVPGQYMTAIKNSDGKYTCTINTTGNVNGYTAKTAPMVMPVETPGYAAHSAPTSYNYNNISQYVKDGLIYIDAGCRGRAFGQVSASSLTASGSAPWGVTDLKAAIRYIRYNAMALPGDAEKIFSFGMSGGGAQSSLLGATGDSPLYTPYLEKIGAAMTDANGKDISDALYGSMAWCPITSLDYADEAYEWMMGQYFTTDTRAKTTWTSALSSDLATSFATYINKLGLTDANGKALTLDQTSNGIYAGGSYYDYLLTIINRSINNFLADTKFPYTSGGNQKGLGGAGGPGIPTGANGVDGQPNDQIKRDAEEQTASVTYQTVQEYIKALNGTDNWIQYDAKTNTAKITSIEAFVTHCKKASKSVGAFDDINRSQGENTVFGIDNNAAHFDSTIADLLNKNQSKYAAYSDWKADYITAYKNDLQMKDELGTTIQTRIDMYNPLYFLLPYYDGNGTSTVAKYWRIRTGINQSDTSLTVESNLALALSKDKNVENVDFETVWGLPHVEAERTGDSTTNFIAWVNECAKAN